MTKEPCNVCAEKYNVSTRKVIQCPSCDFTACRQCVSRYITEGTVQDAHCMSCKTRFTEMFLQKAFTKVWNQKTYRDHRANLLQIQQESLLPDTEVYVQAINEAEELEEQYDGMGKRWQELKKELNKIEKDMGENYQRRSVLLSDNFKPEEIQKREFVMNCCETDCNGFLSNKYKCGLCDTVVCSKCHKKKEEGHECNPDDVKTVAEVKASSKPCPKCGIPTQKISGCPQMWCVSCHAVWDWRTGHLDRSGIIHNPHYYRYMNEQRGGMPRDPRDQLCGGPVDVNDMGNVRYNKLWGTDMTVYQKGYDILREKVHWERYELPKYADTPEILYRKLRVEYMRQKITKEEWLTGLKKFVHKDKVNKEFREVIAMYCATVDGILRDSMQSIHPLFDDIKQITTYANTQLLELSKLYKRKYRSIRFPVN